jgi:hypothetical protein
MIQTDEQIPWYTLSKTFEGNKKFLTTYALVSSFIEHNQDYTEAFTPFIFLYYGKKI